MARKHSGSRFTAWRVVALCAASLGAQASDHLDTAAVVADPAADIGDLYAWLSPDGARLNMAMTIVGRKFSDHVSYRFHIDIGRSPGVTTESRMLECVFDTARAPECMLEDDRARGDASIETGIASDHGGFRVFAGLRDDPFFNNVRGTRAALSLASEALNKGVSRDAAGCPRFDAVTVAGIQNEWRHTQGALGSNFLAGWQIAALVVSVELPRMKPAGPLLGVWATTEVRAAPPGHAPLAAGTPIDRMGRALTANALLGAFESEQAGERRKDLYNRASRDDWSTFAPGIASALAVYDGLDGICGNQWLASGKSASSRYQELALLLADDRLWIDTRSRACGFLGVELHSKTASACGGRTPNDDAVDVFRSLLVAGSVSGIEDGVRTDDRQHSASAFPFLAPP